MGRLTVVLVVLLYFNWITETDILSTVSGIIRRPKIIGNLG